jgi:para-nitrobenzyl esterase
VLARLRATSTLRIAAVQREFESEQPLRTYPLVIDDVILDGDPLRAIREGCARDIDLLIGNTREENRLFSMIAGAWTDRGIAAVTTDLLVAAEARDRATGIYTALASSENLDAYAIDHVITTEHSWAEPVRTAALAHSASGGRTYHFEFAWGSSVDGVGSAHLVELPFFLGNLDAQGVPALLGGEVLTDPETVALGESVSASVAEFIRTGDLSHSALGDWPAYTNEDRATMIIDRTSHVENDHLAERLDFWQSQRGSSAQPLSTVGVGT